MNTLPATAESTARHLQLAAQQEGAAEQLGTLLKFVKGRYYTGDDEVAVGSEYIAHIDQWTFGWIKFEDGQPIEKRIGRAADGFQAPERDEVGDLDESQWPKDANGAPRDPWSRQSYLPLEEIESGEIVVFVTGSHGGRGAIGKLINTAARNFSNGLPQIRLSVSSYRHKTYGRIETPDFPVVGWTGKTSKPKPVSEELNDDIPF